MDKSSSLMTIYLLFLKTIAKVTLKFVIINVIKRQSKEKESINKLNAKFSYQDKIS